MKSIKVCTAGVLLFSSWAFGWDSSIVYKDATTQRLVYKSDANGNRLADFSHAGYQGGTVALPTLAVVKTITPVSGDNTANIQNAINEVAKLTPNASGHRGTVLLKKGTYPVSGIIYINASGIVLRGEGQGTADTVVVGTGTAQMKELGIILVKLSTDGQIVASGTKQNIVSELLPVGSRTIEVENGSVYAVGDRLVIEHVATDAWLQAVRYGDTAGDEVPWTPGLGELTMRFEGLVTAISGNKIKLDSPIYCELKRSLAQATVYKHSGAGVITESGVENLRVISDNPTTNSQNEDHRWDCVHFIGARNCWAKNVTAVGFAEGGIRFSKSIRSTVLSCSALEPVSP
ncbi:MAG: peptidoglycan-binding protein, partial [Kiritimatiellaceae bacterium]|nr:peptidoglycan-binding protein [Kiritimatiellaceae bacterium]